MTVLKMHKKYGRDPDRISSPIWREIGENVEIEVCTSSTFPSQLSSSSTQWPMKQLNDIVKMHQ